jgi:alpha-1,6-mannosyltransferase
VRWLYERFDVVLAPSRLMCEYLASLGVSRAVYQPLGVDAEVFCPARRTLDLRRELGLDPDARLLVFAGRFAGEKNLHVLMKAFAKLGAPYHLLLVGGGRHARPARNVTMVPFRRDSVELASWLASCDALVHAGTKETFGLVVVEAMACGRPVVGTRAGAIPEIVDESVGALAEPLNADSLADAIAALYERDLEAVGAAARAKVLSQFTWSQALQVQLASYAKYAGLPRLAVGVRPVVGLGSPTS